MSLCLSPRHIYAQICVNPYDYAPSEYHPSHTPMKYIKINVHILRDENGQNNFPDVDGNGNDEAIDFVKELICQANTKLANNEEMNIHTGTPPRIDTDTFDNGMYLCVLLENGRVLEQTKMIVLK